MVDQRKYLDFAYNFNSFCFSTRCSNTKIVCRALCIGKYRKQSSKVVKSRAYITLRKNILVNTNFVPHEASILLVLLVF